MNDPIKENKQLKEDIKILQQVINEQNRLINDYRANTLINMYSTLQAIIDEYSLFLNPPEINIKASYQNKSEAYKIKIEKLIGIFSNGRTKKILLEENISGIGSNERDTNFIFIESSWALLIEKLDSKKFHLCEIDKSTYINVKFYDISRDELFIKPNIENIPLEFSKFLIKGKYKKDFIIIKEQYDKIYSLQKLLVDYKLKNGLPL